MYMKTRKRYFLAVLQFYHSSDLVCKRDDVVHIFVIKEDIGLFEKQ